MRRFATDGRMVAALAGNVTVGHQGHSAAPPNFRRGVICPHFLGVAAGLADYRCRVRKVQSDATSTPYHITSSRRRLRRRCRQPK
jgi:hypothetical protein